MNEINSGSLNYSCNYLSSNLTIIFFEKYVTMRKILSQHEERFKK